MVAAEVTAAVADTSLPLDGWEAKSAFGQADVARWFAANPSLQVDLVDRSATIAETETELAAASPSFEGQFAASPKAASLLNGPLAGRVPDGQLLRQLREPTTSDAATQATEMINCSTQASANEAAAARIEQSVAFMRQRAATRRRELIQGSHAVCQMSMSIQHAAESRSQTNREQEVPGNGGHGQHRRQIEFEKKLMHLLD